MNISFFKPFIEGTKNTLKIQCNIDITHDKPFIKGSQTQPDFDIAGIIAINSAELTASMAICFPKSVYLKVISSMLGEVYTEITDELQDGAAELLNIIFGAAKVALNQQGYTLQKAIPTVICGKQISTNQTSKGSVIVIPFKIGDGEFHIEIAIGEDSVKLQ